MNTPYSFADNKWHHIATIADGAPIKTYYDGALQNSGGSSIGTGDYGSSADNVHIGGGGVFSTGGNFFLGKIDEVAIFDKAIPAARIKAHFDAGKLGGVIVTSSTVIQPSSGPKITTSRSGNSLTISWSPAGGTLIGFTLLS